MVEFSNQLKQEMSRDQKYSAIEQLDSEVKSEHSKTAE